MLAVAMTPPVATLPAYMSGTPGHSTGTVSPVTTKRPKLSLQTSGLSSSFGGLSKGLSGNLNTQATATPTTANTFSNTWDLTFRPSPVSRTSSPRPLPPTRSESPQQPYNVVLPFGFKSILKNSPLPAESIRSTSPRETRRKVLFPPAKKVTFKRHLENIIETNIYVAKHSDLPSSSDDDDDSSVSDDSEDLPEQFTDSENAHRSSPPPAKRRRGRRSSGMQVSSRSPREDHEAETPNVTPRADRKRRWEWTLAPISDKTASAAIANRHETGLVEGQVRRSNSRAKPGSTSEQEVDQHRQQLPRSGGPRRPERCDADGQSPSAAKKGSNKRKESPTESSAHPTKDGHGNQLWLGIAVRKAKNGG